MKSWKNDILSNEILKQASITTLIYNKANFKPKSIKRDKGHYIVAKRQHIKKIKQL